MKAKKSSLPRRVGRVFAILAGAGAAVTAALWLIGYAFHDPREAYVAVINDGGVYADVTAGGFAYLLTDRPCDGMTDGAINAPAGAEYATRRKADQDRTKADTDACFTRTQAGVRVYTKNAAPLDILASGIPPAPTAAEIAAVVAQQQKEAVDAAKRAAAERTAQARRAADTQAAVAAATGELDVKEVITEGDGKAYGLTTESCVAAGARLLSTADAPEAAEAARAMGRRDGLTYHVYKGRDDRGDGCYRLTSDGILTASGYVAGKRVRVVHH